jgi:hypothetical protein
MNRIFIVILIAGLFFCPLAASAADFGAYDGRKINEDFRRQRDELKKNKQIIEENQRDRRQVEEAMKQDEYEAKRLQDESRQGGLISKLAQEEEAARTKLSGLTRQAGRDESFGITLSRPLQALLYFLIIVFFGLAYYYAIVLSKKKRAVEAGSVLAEMGDNLLAMVNHWKFLEDNFTDYQNKIAALLEVPPAEINSPQLKKHFIKDIAITEILCQYAVNNKFDTGYEFKAPLDNYKAYLSQLEQKEAAFLNTLNNYKRSFTGIYGRRMPYVSYYKDFLDLLMLINRPDEAAGLEAYTKYLLVNKIIANTGAEPSDTAKIQQELDIIINGFKLEYNVIIKEENIGVIAPAQPPPLKP